VSRPVLALEGVMANYGPVRALHGVDLLVEPGEVVVLLGANGAGKTTTMRAISGQVGVRGSIRIQGTETCGWPTRKIAGLGVAHVPQGRGTFPDLTVEENLRIGAYLVRDRRAVAAATSRWLEAFPVLGDRRRQRAGLLSGGEQQMLAIARALMGAPSLLMVDEPSLGLAPKLVADVFERLAAINRDDGVAMLIVEQNAALALRVATRAYVLAAGRMVLTGTAEELVSNDEVQEAYLR
jgi:branched-chain amino acid transport system ATP-binding protein